MQHLFLFLKVQVNMKIHEYYNITIDTARG